MKESDSVFGVELDRLKRLLSVGKEESGEDSSEYTSRTASFWRSCSSFGTSSAMSLRDRRPRSLTKSHLIRDVTGPFQSPIVVPGERLSARVRYVSRGQPPNSRRRTSSYPLAASALTCRMPRRITEYGNSRK